MGAAAFEADEPVSPRLVVLSVSHGEASSIRFPGTTKVGREEKEDGCDVSISGDEILAGLALGDSCLLIRSVDGGGCCGGRRGSSRRSRASRIATPWVRRGGWSLGAKLEESYTFPSSRNRSLAPEAYGAVYYLVFTPLSQECWEPQNPGQCLAICLLTP